MQQWACMGLQIDFRNGMWKKKRSDRGSVDVGSGSFLSLVFLLALASKAKGSVKR